MKTTVIYHSADFDGIFCREIAKHFLGENDVDYIGWNFGDARVPIPEEGTIYVMDLPVDRVFGYTYPGDVFSTRSIFNRLIWIDHHKSSIATHPTEISGYRIDGVAACRLAWQWFRRIEYETKNPEMTTWALPDKQAFIDRMVNEPLAVRLAGEYDIWDKRDPDAEVFQFGLRSTKDVNFELLFEGSHGLYFRWLLERGHLLQSYQQEVDASVVKNQSFMVKFKGLKFLVINSARFNSLTFASKDVPETGHDALMGFRFNGNQWTFSLYHAKHRTDLDLSVIAVEFGGGGHRGACGFQATTAQAMDIIDGIME